MADTDTALCRTVVDVYRAALAKAIEDVTEHIGSAVATCGREASQEPSSQGRLTVFTRCLAARTRARAKPG